MNFYEVLTNKRIFTYESIDLYSVGTEVVVPFRNKKTSGFIISQVNKPSFKTRAIEYPVRNLAQFDGKLVELCDWISDFYKCYRGKTLELVLPK